MHLEEFIAALDRHEAAWLSLPHNRIGFVPGGSVLVVSFMALAEDEAADEKNPEAIWGGSFLEARGHSILGVQRQRNDWYRSPDLHRALLRLADAGFFSRFERVMFYGGSMGGFAALAFASLAPGCTVLAHNPQSTLRPSATPWEGRFDFARQLDWDGRFSDGAQGARQARVVYASYDPWCEEDRRHVDRLEGCHLVRLPIPHVGHQVPLWLQQLKVLGRVFDEALAGQLTSQGFRVMVRGRSALPRYALQLTQRRIAARRASCILERARSDHPHDAGVREALWNFTRRRHVLPARQTPRVVLWLHDEADARAVADELDAGWPGLAIALDPLHAIERPVPLAELLRRPAHPPMVADEIRRLLYGHPLVLHVVQPRGMRHCQWLDAMLLKTATSEGYRHVLLYRRHPRRATSDVRAEWEALALLGELMHADGTTPRVLRLDGHSTAHADDTLDAWLQERLGARLPRDLPPPTVFPTRLDLRHWPTPDLGTAAYRLTVQPVAPARGQLHLDPMDPAFASHGSVPLTGLAVPPADLPATSRLVLRVGEAPPSEVRWGLPSPGGVHRFPGHALATKARFGPAVIPVLPDQTILLGWLAPDGGMTPMATCCWTALTARHHLPGVLWSDQQLGLLPLPGTGSSRVVWAIEQALGVAPNEAMHPGNAAWGVDISGVAHRFAVVADPVRRFQSLCNAAVDELPALKGMATIDRMRWIAERLEQARGRAEAPWMARFASQAQRIDDAGPVTVLSWRDRQRAQSWLSERLACRVKLPAAPLKERWQALRLGPHREVPSSLVGRILDLYAQDETLYRDG